MSGVVQLRWKESGIAVIAMEDRESRNRCSAAWIEGIDAAFGEVEGRADSRVIVIHGYDAYFSCGGTEEELLQMAAGRLRFNDYQFYDRLLKCPVPVIAAMQGHAIGGGLVFGAYADVPILAEECLYSANFMEYGFTPGMGATWVLPQVFGPVLAWEMMLTARNYQGAELRRRGVPVRVMPKADVVPSAMAMAAELARKPAVALRELKRARLSTAAPALAAAVERELRMHDVTFSQPAVREMIRDRYGA